ncbi:hypothetical protein F0L74_27220 [Chitinophaga agrisoli]|uniref:Helix-turn-helix protein n=1 Tax=Chitinophaga agrisoli TaxID=2607653 RepID=A0A5B2VMJ6_9BACT|nr:hypothetical protein [Chitinophaga agrisoli]KAA2239880.1 hypothetical protein F0L74_27220 [Chitinophaga agrisoli]
MKRPPLSSQEEAIKDAVLNDILSALLLQNSLTPLLLRSKQIVGIFRVSPSELCFMRENGVISTVKRKGVHHYNPMDILDLLLTKN